MCEYITQNLIVYSFEVTSAKASCTQVNDYTRKHHYQRKLTV